ncbi:heterogeneous nuclear ribonucleoprotein A1 [Achlya hypogyna]|uniref:Heterogeneous nuclear ribonucleoprotein A1 n=1 Tax=Achlya hypogyna TaxID=1202772 RepID=A0A1V9YG10_ACHHY|nr:heterogeneous nuclear ribonucleoprotein A1 [Achlya hypogyna]
MTDSSPKIGKIFIGGLSYETTDDKLRSYFSAYGTVTDAVVMKDPISRRSRGFGFITYADPACVDRALAQPNHVLDNRRVEAKRAVPRAESNRDTSSISTRGNVSAGSSVSSASAVGATKKIFVGGLHYETKDADFKKYFQQFGKVVSAEVMFNRETNKSRGFGFVIFETEASVELVLQDKTHVIDGKSVEVKRAVPRTDAPPTTTGSVRSVSNRGGSFSGQSSDHELLSPRSTPASPMTKSNSHHHLVSASFSSLDGSHAASSLGGYAAAVRYGSRSIPNQPLLDHALVDHLESMSLDGDGRDPTLDDDESHPPNGSMLHGWTSQKYQQPQYDHHTHSYHPQAYPPNQPPPHWQQWRQWPEHAPPTPDQVAHEPPANLFGMFASGATTETSWDPPQYENGSFSFGATGFRPSTAFGIDAPLGSLHDEFREPDLDGPFRRFGMSDDRKKPYQPAPRRDEFPPATYR